MKSGRMQKNTLCILALALMLVWSCPQTSQAGSKSLELSQIKLTAPTSAQEKQYLGIDEKRSFALSEVNAKYILLGYYTTNCPHCHEQAPISNQIFKMIQDDPGLSKNVKMLGVIVGGTPQDAESYVNQFKISYPVVTDPFFDIYRKLDKPKVPLTVLIRKDGEVLLSVTGAMADPAGFVKKIKQAE